MELKLYQKNGYVDIENILKFAKENKCPFIFITGGRGTGKTFTTLKHFIDTKQQFIYLRRKQTQVDIINKQEFSPFKPISKMMKREIISVPVTKFNAGFYFGVWDGGKEKFYPEGDALCFSAGLTTMSNLRSIGIVDDCKALVYDEFIPEKHENAIKNEAMAFLNCYETINRNREFDGGEPLTCICLANAMNIGNAIFNELGLIDIADDMEIKDHAYRVLKERGVLLIRLAHSPISTMKKKTALYRMTEGTGFYDMSVQNYFAFEEKGNIKQYPIKEFSLYAEIDNLCIYRHKSINLFYVSKHKSGNTKERYKNTTMDRTRFRAEHPEIGAAYMFHELYFDRYGTELLFKSFMGIK